MMAQPKAMESVVRNSNGENPSGQLNLSRSLEVVEYVTLAASVVGVGISAVFRQAVYAAAPLSLAVFLNLINRKRFEQKTQKSITATVEQLEQQLSQLSHDFPDFQQQVKDELAQQHTQLTQAINSFPQQSITTRVNQAEQQLSQLSHDFSDFQQQVKGELSQQRAQLTQALNSFPPQSITTTVNQVEQQLSRLNHDFSDFQQQVKDELSQQRAQLTQDLTPLTATKQASSSPRENKQQQTDKQQRKLTQQPALSKSSRERVKEEISDEKETEVETLLELFGLEKD